MVIQIAHEAGIPLTERNVSLTEVYTADEVFTTGTVGELSPVLEVDGRKIGEEGIRPVTTRATGALCRTDRQRRRTFTIGGVQ